MTVLVHELCIVPMLGTLKNLDAIVSKAEVHVDADEGIDEATMVGARLYPNMLNFVYQIQIATDTAKGAAARLSGRDVPSWPDEEKTFAQIHERIAKAVDYLGGIDAADFMGAESRSIDLKLGPYDVNFSGSAYIAKFVLPNFYFHVTTAYNILRHHGVVIGKLDYLGPVIENA